MDTIKELEARSAEALKFLKEGLSGIRGGRPSPKLVENIVIDYFGQKLRIVQLASISVVLPREIQIMVWDRNALSAVVKAVEDTLKIKASTDSNIIRINLPALSEERRAELVKIVKKEIEETKIKIRNLRDEILKAVKADEEAGEITEDDKFRLKEKIQKKIEELNKEIEVVLENKIKEISE